jgi:hypothetical protein
MDFFILLIFIINKEMSCIAIKSDGNVCNHKCEGHERCGTHRNQIHNKGPNKTKKDELSYIHLKKKKELTEKLLNNEIEEREYKRLKIIENFRYETDVLVLNEQIEENIRITGIDPDNQAKQRRRERQRELLNLRANRIRNRIEGFVPMYIQREINFDNINLEQNERPLEGFANDRQNVHKKETVENVKKNVELILKINVPDEYQTETLKTLSEIIADCNLSKKAAWQMTAKYCEEESIYEMEGIYPKILNSIWQFIKFSEHKEDLKKILKSEMEDNIGMCAQGNLSRLCNILNGYLDGFQFDTENQIEKLGNELYKLMEIENYAERMEKAIEILKKFNIDESKWIDWTEPLMDHVHRDLEELTGILVE